MSDLVNALTGKQPTAKEAEAIQRRAIDIFKSPYSSPEQIEWAIAAYPEGFAEAIIQRPKPWEQGANQ